MVQQFKITSPYCFQRLGQRFGFIIKYMKKLLELAICCGFDNDNKPIFSQHSMGFLESNVARLVVQGQGEQNPAE